jgi:hypothetical protein
VHSCLRQSWLWALWPMTYHKPTLYFYGDKTKVYPSILFYLFFYIYNRAKNIFKHVLSMCMTSTLWQRRKYFVLPIIGYTNTRNFCLIIWKPNTMPLYCDTTLYNFHYFKYKRQHPFQLYQQRMPLCSFCTCDLGKNRWWQ